MTKIHFRPYNPNQTVLFPQRIDEDIAENDPVRMVDALVEGLNLESFRKLYKECGRSPYHPRMMLKVILYAYMEGVKLIGAVQGSILSSLEPISAALFGWALLGNEFTLIGIFGMICIIATVFIIAWDRQRQIKREVLKKLNKEEIV